MAESEFECADLRSARDYPPEWGLPPGRRLSEERARWVLDHVRRLQSDPRHQLRRLDAAARRAQVEPLERLAAEAREKGLTGLADDLDYAIGRLS